MSGLRASGLRRSAPPCSRPASANTAPVRRVARQTRCRHSGPVRSEAPGSSAAGPESGSGGPKLPSQLESVTAGVDRQGAMVEVLDRDEEPKPPDMDYLQELLAIQQNGAKNIAFFGTRNMGFLHQQLIEILSYAMVLTGNHIYTSGGLGTNAAVIRGALRAEKPELLTVILPQSMHKQPEELHELLEQVEDLQCLSENDSMKLLDASRICNQKIITYVQQIICFAFHDSHVLLRTCKEARETKTVVTLLFLD